MTPAESARGPLLTKFDWQRGGRFCPKAGISYLGRRLLNAFCRGCPSHLGRAERANLKPFQMILGSSFAAAARDSIVSYLINVGVYS